MQPFGDIADHWDLLDELFHCNVLSKPGKDTLARCKSLQAAARSDALLPRTA
jgi:hypothetical protein